MGVLVLFLLSQTVQMGYLFFVSFFSFLFLGVFSACLVLVPPPEGGGDRGASPDPFLDLGPPWVVPVLPNPPLCPSLLPLSYSPPRSPPKGGDRGEVGDHPSRFLEGPLGPSRSFCRCCAMLSSGSVRSSRLAFELGRTRTGTPFRALTPKVRLATISTQVLPCPPFGGGSGSSQAKLGRTPFHLTSSHSFFPLALVPLPPLGPLQGAMIQNGIKIWAISPLCPIFQWTLGESNSFLTRARGPCYRCHQRPFSGVGEARTHKEFLP